MNPPPRCARCRSWCAEPTPSLKAVNAGALWGWCQHPHFWEMLKREAIDGEHKLVDHVGLRTRAESKCPLFVRRT